MLSSFGGMTNYFVFLAVGKLVIFILQTAGILEPVWNLFRTLEEWARRYFAFWPADHFISEEFRECGFCVGCWVFSFLAIYGKINVLDIFINNWVSYILTGFLSSFVVHLLSGGWKYHFGE